MRTYATAQAIGLRSFQCDATAIHTAPSGARAFVVLDGIGDGSRVREWTRTAARRLARAASRRADAEAGLRHIYADYAADLDRHDPEMARWMPSAAALVALYVPGEPLQLAWCGDVRAYLLRRGIAHRLTEDHNARRVYPPTALYPEGGNRNMITSYLGGVLTDDQAMAKYNHPAIETWSVPLDGPCRLALLSDGAYEPHLEDGNDLYVELEHDPIGQVATEFVDLAVETSIQRSKAEDPEDPYADNATVLLADLT
ncbi:protein phosphatase 2C domain-containing protein [Actinacidiphila sp. DG2A-62]|uniref:protein phosphatase 2C domain-containing protein n=1 Tax=Actinacidiphila sp. DG2A-62 TaxID=3108821 RepID=UPI002DBCFAD7|nr:protein phosphatase 2C domain-containing protein [Actinacidiphila sp. DG2A-62]MEC3995192.1 protein phosphatase 2C domain-containing protein [Actinacidiphila sp. DG2A-62]